MTTRKKRLHYSPGLCRVSCKLARVTERQLTGNTVLIIQTIFIVVIEWFRR